MKGGGGGCGGCRCAGKIGFAVAVGVGGVIADIRVGGRGGSVCA